MPGDGFLNLLKPPGMTSHDAVAWARRLAGVAVGHAGTLDRAAAGVLVLCLGRARRLARWATAADKSYIAEVAFGVTTDTLDAEGTVLEDADASGLTPDAVAAALRDCEGEIQQRVPAYSAVQVGGERLYALARQGRPTPAPTRRVRIMSARLLDFFPGRTPRARILVHCSKGTYIRSLAADLGQALGCGAHLAFLVRTRSGSFDIADSVTIEQAQAAADAGGLDGLLAPLDAPLAGLPAVRLEEREARLAAHGGAIAAPAHLREAGAWARLYGGGGRFIGVAESDGASLRPRVVVAE